VIDREIGAILDGRQVRLGRLLDRSRIAGLWVRRGDRRGGPAFMAGPADRRIEQGIRLSHR
jgi:hypothetical protein